MGMVSHFLSVVGMGVAALLVGSSSGLVKLLENKTQTFFYLLRGPIPSPKDIVILAIDEASISRSQQYYQADPQKYAYLESIKTWPYKRQAYAQVIEKLIQAGARSVALDIVLDTESSYGPDDDRQLKAVLKRYGDKVTLAALYETFESHQGNFMQLTLPHEMFRQPGVSIGSVNFPLEADGKVHRLAREFVKSLANEDLKIPSFDQAVLESSGVNYTSPGGVRIYFYGSNGTFEQISFSSVLDPENWNNYLQQGKYFQNKIVLVGATAKLMNDYHGVALAANWFQSENMSGVEIHANAIATLVAGKTVNEAIRSPYLRGLFVFIVVGICIFLISRNKHGIHRFFISIGLGFVWVIITYGLFIYGQLILPVAIPIIAICTVGIIYLSTEITREILRKRQLIDILKKNVSNRLAQEIISQQDDLRDLLHQREMEICGKILGGRYKITKVLGAGGFSETYIAEDTQLPNHPLCVVKQLKPVNAKSEQLEVARRLFKSEAQTLQKLGIHEQIPQLFAYFEEDEEFYLIQEYIPGHALSEELRPGRVLPEILVIFMLQDLLQTLSFVHENGVIHRDIKPNNIIPRQQDGKLVLIDFGAVKEVSTQLLDNTEQSAFTIGIGTKGYAPREQCLGRPQYSSDIYALGMIGIKALTGVSPHALLRNVDGHLMWTHKARVGPTFAAILNKMIQEDPHKRYQSTVEVLEVLNQLIDAENTALLNQGMISLNFQRFLNGFKG
ncbi:Serine/threonine kinase [Richelia intracellularis]|nr:Serine/threonine kinase [Richelia intracellularis]